MSHPNDGIRWDDVAQWSEPIPDDPPPWDDEIHPDDFAALVDSGEWTRRAMEDFPRPRWTRVAGKYPLDELLAPANLRVLRVIWSHARPVYWPSTVARMSGLSRSAVYRALAALAEWRIAERFPAHDGRPGSFCYRLRRKDPLVVALHRLFEMEAKIDLESVAPEGDPAPDEAP